MGMVSWTQSTVTLVSPALVRVTSYDAVPPPLGSTPAAGEVSFLAMVTGAVDDTDGSAPSAIPPASVCFTWVPLAMYWIGFTSAGMPVGPIARNTYRAVYCRLPPLAPDRYSRST